ncbi:hypothetical protein BD410DRAFT_785832 [Rickenella mellea]|uniref:AN1-type domain-containing protein n=1 Tax=Rickenella mellea TaxID=50990 RepID=A0A4Y7QDW2_9AGAM|nr:hypothetical protein BD410DRAFT_785832 [Rickenella mellea]
MDLAVIGTHCSLLSCRELDLLPVKCRCEKLFCRRHFLPDDHDCLANQSDTPSTPFSATKRPRCAFEACNFRHRHPPNHSCATVVDNPIDKRGAARNVLQRVLPTTTKPTPKSRVLRPSTTSATKLAHMNRVAAMQMRQRAIAGEPGVNAASVDISDRLHVGVKVDNRDAEEFYWFRKNTSVGRVVDLIGARNGAAESDIYMLYLVNSDGPDQNERMHLSYDRVLSQVVTEGSHLMLVRVTNQADSQSSV